MKFKVSAYFSASIRGKNRDFATKEEISHNMREALKVSSKIKSIFGSSLDLYVPHEKDDLIQILISNKAINTKDVLSGDCEILSTKDFLIVYKIDNYLSEGVRIEIEKASSLKKSIVIFSSLSNKVLKNINNIISTIINSRF